MTRPKMSYAEYLALERASEQKHEYLRGDVWAMAGGTLEHTRLTMQIGYLLRLGLQGRPCVVFGPDGKVRIEVTDRSTYPDVSVVCGSVQRATDDENALTNPIVLVEVLSEGTERSDRGEKFAHYQRLESLQDYVLISQDSRRVEVFSRGDAGTWVLKTSVGGEHVRLQSIEVSFSVDELYADPTRPAA